MLYDIKPPRTDYYDVFYFETRMRDMIEEYMEPFIDTMKDDKATTLRLRFDYDNLMDRMHELEAYALIKNWQLKPNAAWEDVLKELLPEDHFHKEEVPKVSAREKGAISKA